MVIKFILFGQKTPTSATRHVIALYNALICTNNGNSRKTGHRVREQFLNIDVVDDGKDRTPTPSDYAR